jgi:hypothetical protein
MNTYGVSHNPWVLVINLLVKKIANLQIKRKDDHDVEISAFTGRNG